MTNVLFVSLCQRLYRWQNDFRFHETVRLAPLKTLKCVVRVFDVFVNVSLRFLSFGYSESVGVACLHHGLHPFVTTGGDRAAESGVRASSGQGERGRGRWTLCRAIHCLWWVLHAHAHTHTHARTHARTYVHTGVDTYAHARTQTRAAHTHTRHTHYNDTLTLFTPGTHWCACVYAHAHTHTLLHLPLSV